MDQDVYTDTHFHVHLMLSSSHTSLPLFMCNLCFLVFIYGFCLAGCFWLIDSSWMSGLGPRWGPECVGWPLEPFCVGKAHTTLPHTFLTHPGDIPPCTKAISHMKSINLVNATYLLLKGLKCCETTQQHKYTYF